MSYLTEAFKALDALNEDTFSVSDDGIKKLAEFEDNDDLVDEITVYDADAEDTEDLEDSYVGKVIVDCNVCHSKIYKDKSDVVIDEETQNANIDEECPYCYSTDGFKVIGEVAPMTTETEEKVEVEDDIETHEDSDNSTTETEENVELEESLNEATVTDYKGSLSNILVKNQDKISKMTNKGEIVKFLDSITDEVRDKNYLETVKRNMQKKNDFGALQYIYGIILSGEGKGVTESLEENIGTDIDEYQQWVDYDMKRYGKISNQTNKEIKEAGLQVVKDKYGDYQVIAGKYDESLKETLGRDIISMIDKRSIEEIDGVRYVYDYLTQEDLAEVKDIVLKILRKEFPNSTFEVYSITLTYDELSMGVLKDDVDFNRGISIKLNRFDYSDNLNKVLNKYTPQLAHELIDEMKSTIFNISMEESLKESVKDVTITTDDSRTTMTSEDDGKVTVTTEPVEQPKDDEVIEPLTDETETEIESNDGEEDIDIEDFDEESFDELGEGYFKNVYENVNSFKTSNITTKDNKVIVEGVITFDNNVKKNTSFLFESANKTKNGKYRFIGENLNVTKGNKAFSLIGNVTDKKFLSESMNYNYRTKNDIGKFIRCCGTIKRG